MFGNTHPPGDCVSIWLDHLRKAELGTARGALVHRNVMTDGNVCAEFREAFCSLMERQPAVLTPEDAGKAYDYVLTQLDAMGCAFCDAANRVNRLEPVPFPRIAHVTDVKSFVKWNVFGKDRAPRHLYDGRKGLGRALSEVRRKRGDVRTLKGTVGDRCVYATNVDTLGADPDEVRDSLGLDDDYRFAKEQYLVVTVYDQSIISARGCYRPTVLDAGWGPISGAFLPSPVGPAAPGLTQHLKTGDPCLPEIIHTPVPANQVQRYEVVGPLRSDPSTQYKAKRLGAWAR